MATVAQLETSIAELKAAVTQEKAEISALLDKQTTLIASLQAEIETGENPKLDAPLAGIAAITEEIKGIVTPG